jgi:hypothetical protein
MIALYLNTAELRPDGDHIDGAAVIIKWGLLRHAQITVFLVRAGT